MPKEIQEGIIYISEEFSISKHKCPCGCGEVINIPIHEHRGWTINIVDDKVSFNPSIGNWYLKCKSHYYIKNNKIIWC